MVLGLKSSCASQQGNLLLERLIANRHVQRPSTATCSCISTGFPRSRLFAPREAPAPRRSNTAASTLQLPRQVKTPTDVPQPSTQLASPGADTSPGAPDNRPTRVTYLPNDFLQEFERRLEADVATIAATVTAVTGVIFFWRGVWSLLDHFIGDSVSGDVGCCVLGLCIIFWIRISGARLGTFWPGA
jgi:hypothetical protein